MNDGLYMELTNALRELGELKADMATNNRILDDEHEEWMDDVLHPEKESMPAVQKETENDKLYSLIDKHNNLVRISTESLMTSLYVIGVTTIADLLEMDHDDFKDVPTVGWNKYWVIKAAYLEVFNAKRKADAMRRREEQKHYGRR